MNIQKKLLQHQDKLSLVEKKFVKALKENEPADIVAGTCVELMVLLGFCHLGKSPGKPIVCAFDSPAPFLWTLRTFYSLLSV